MLKRISIIIFILSLHYLHLESHNEFYKLENSKLVLLTYPPSTGMVVWSSSQAGSIPVYFKNWDVGYLPAELGGPTSKTQVMDAGGDWHSSSGCFGFQETSDITNGVQVSFNTTSTIFPNPDADGGVTVQAVENGKIVVSCSTCQNQGVAMTEIVFNNSSNFRSHFIWTNSTSGVSSGRVCFKSVALHELGHVIGLNHCSNSSAIMYAAISAGANYKGPQSPDITGLHTLCVVTPVCQTCPPPAPKNFSATIVGQDVVLSWDQVDIYSWGITLHINENAVGLSTQSTSYTDIGAVSSLPRAYYVATYNGYGSNPTTTINVSVAPSVISQTPPAWTGVVYVNSSVTVNPGVLLMIGASTKIIFQSGNSLGITVNGQLFAMGQPNGLVTFTSSSATPTMGDWGKIILNGSGAAGSNLNYVNMQYGYEIDALSTSNITIQNSIIQNTINGIYAYYCSSGSFVNNTITNSSGHGISLYFSSNCLAQRNTIQNSNVYHGILITGGSNNNCYENVISKTNNNHQGAGILYSGSNGYVGGNDIHSFNWGIGAIWGASPYSLYSNALVKNNRVADCISGLMVYHLSYPIFGTPPPSLYAQNSIHGNGYYSGTWHDQNISFNTDGYNTSTLYAWANYWGTSNPPSTFVVGSGSTVYYYPFLSTDPWQGSQSPSIQTKESVKGQIVASVSSAGSSNQAGSIPNMNGDDPIPVDPLFAGIELRQQGKVKEAKDFFRSYLDKHTDNQRAYVELYNCYSDETAKEITKYFEALPSSAAKEQKLLLGNLYLRQGDAKSAKQVNSSIISANPGTSIAVKAMLNNFFIALYNENNPADASALLKDVMNNVSLSTSMEIADAQHALEIYGGGGSSQPHAQSLESLPVTVGLSQNYPNPFNPVTTFTYRIDKPGIVSLKVFDVLGREVATLVNGEQAEGSYTQRFDASHLSSGIYFYRLLAPGVNETRKMLIAK